MSFVKVSSEDGEQPMELPIETDETLLLSTVCTLFPGATGLKYRPMESETYRGLRLTDGRFYPPSDGSWTNYVFYCVFPKEMKRKGEIESLTSSFKTKKFDQKRCTDMVVLGMAWKTTEDTMREYFSQFGDLAMVQLKRDPATQQSKGYGFIRFTDYGAQVSCLSERHNIDGRWCEVKIPNSKIEGDRQEVSRKIYVGGISDSISADNLKDFFQQYGTVSDVFIPKPFRNFAFVTFVEADVAQDLLGRQLQLGVHTINIGSAAPKPPHGMRHNIGNNASPNGEFSFRGAQDNSLGQSGGFQSVGRFPQASQQGSMDPNTALAALNMLNNPAIMNVIMSLTAGSVGQPTSTQGFGSYMGNNPYMDSGSSSRQHQSNSNSSSRYRGSGRYN